MKICSKCDILKEDNEFRKESRSKDGLNSRCVSCEKIYFTEYRAKNKIKTRAACLAHYYANKEKLLSYRKQFAKENKEVVRGWNNKFYALNKEKIKTRRKERELPYADLIRKAKRDRMRKYRATPTGYIKSKLRDRLRDALRRQNVNKTSKTLELIGCSIGELIIYLESKFHDGMTWKNYGKYGWHIDHIKPCSSFNLNDPQQQKECFHYTNLQPLWACDNLSKGSRLNWRKRDEESGLQETSLPSPP